MHLKVHNLPSLFLLVKQQIYFWVVFKLATIMADGKQGCQAHVEIQVSI